MCDVAVCVVQVVLMSATLDSNLFAHYYGDCPVLVAGGRTFPVEHYFLEDTYELTGCVGDPASTTHMSIELLYSSLA